MQFLDRSQGFGDDFIDSPQAVCCHKTRNGSRSGCTSVEKIGAFSQFHFRNYDEVKRLREMPSNYQTTVHFGDLAHILTVVTESLD